MLRRYLTSWAALFALAGGAASQVVPICGPVPHDGNPNFRYLSGGHAKRIHTWVNPFDPSHVRVWIADDGGRVRFSDDGGASWVIQDTPLEAAQVLIAIHFHSDGQTGYAAGRGGRLLKTTNAGNDWFHVDPNDPTEFAKDGNPTVHWGVHFFEDNANIGIKAGLWDFQSTVNGGQDWADLDVFTDLTFTTTIDHGDLEFYFLSIRGTVSGGWTGVAGANWHTHMPGNESRGVVFYTDSTQPQFSLGRKWAIVLDQPQQVINDPWDFSHEGLGNGFMVGGTGTSNGSIWRTDDGGLTWDEEHETSATNKTFATLYGVANLDNGNAIAVGYGGNIWVRDPSTQTWKPDFVPGYTAPLFDAAANLGTQEAWVTGSFGFLRKTTDGGATWQTQNNGEYLVRVRDLDFIDRNNGVIVGQPGQIFRTSDGGCTFSRVYPPTGIGPGMFTGVVMKDANVGVAVGLEGRVRLTGDGGFTWPAAGAGFTSSQHLNGLIRRSGPEFWAVGQDGSTGEALVALSLDDGATWTAFPPLPGGTGTTLNGVAFVKQDEGFVVGQSGGVAKVWRVTPSTGQFIEVSPPADPTGAARGLLCVTAGIIHNQREVYAGGEGGLASTLELLQRRVRWRAWSLRVRSDGRRCDPPVDRPRFPRHRHPLSDQPDPGGEPVRRRPRAVAGGRLCAPIRRQLLGTHPQPHQSPRPGV